jgi:hypothetical protein
MNTPIIDVDRPTAAVTASLAAEFAIAIDAVLAQVSSRELLAGTEVVNLLLDLRQIAAAVTDQSVERV